MRQYLYFFGVFSLLCLTVGTAHAEKRVALVVGNAAYQKVTPLANSLHDADAMAAMFTSSGFGLVVLKRDLTVADTRRVLRDFADSARDADVAVVYFAGHGIEIDGTNYVVPVDAALERDIDAFDEAIPLDRILSVIEPAKQLRLVILDACRENPFSNTMKRTNGQRAVSRGLARIDPTSPNTLVAYAAKAGSTASDGDSKNSPFTTALMKYLPKPGLDLRKALGFARDDVLRATNNRQEPFTYGSLGGDDVALVPGAVPDLRPTMDAVAATDTSNTRRDYELAERVGTREAWDFFIATYPNGFYTKLAQAQRNKLLAEQERVAAAEKARLVQEEQNRLAAERAKAAEHAAKALAEEQARVTAELAKKTEGAKIVAKSTPEDEAPRPASPRIDTAMNIPPPPRREPLPSRTLLTEMGSRTRWAIGSTSNCNVAKSAYTLEVNSGSIIWRNGLGSVNIESVVSSSENELYTTTRSSVQKHSDNVTPGQPWTYTRDGDRIRVRADGRSAFTLFRCS